MANINRRDFIKFLKGVGGLAGMGLVFGPIVGYLFPKELETVPSEPVLVSHKDDLVVGKSKTVPFGRYPAIIVNTVNGLRAYLAVCTHFACVTKWDEELEQLVCPCHEGYFSVETGEVIAGPPPEGLLPLNIDIVDENK